MRNENLTPTTGFISDSKDKTLNDCGKYENTETRNDAGRGQS